MDRRGTGRIRGTRGRGVGRRQALVEIDVDDDTQSLAADQYSSQPEAETQQPPPPPQEFPNAVGIAQFFIGLQQFFQAFQQQPGAQFLFPPTAVQQPQQQQTGVVARPSRARHQGASTKLMTEFMKLNPPEFEGALGQDPVEFLHTLEGVFAVLHCTDAERVELAGFRLRGTVRTWWRGFEGTRNSWIEFSEALISHTLPECVREARAQEFLSCSQLPGESVTEYVDRFVRLSRFAPIEYGTEAARAKIFFSGVRPRLARMVAQMRYNTVRQYAEVLSAIEAVDTRHPKEGKKQRVERRPVSGGQHDQGQSGYSRQRRSFQSGRSQSTGVVQPTKEAERQTNRHTSRGTSRVSHPFCSRCGSYHSGICNKVSGNCFYCNKKGHRIVDCFSRKRDEAAGIKTSTSGAGAQGSGASKGSGSSGGRALK